VAGSQQPVIGVLALQGDVAEHVRAVAATGARPVSVRRPAELDEVQGLIIPGGESTAITRLARAFGLDEPLRKRIADGMPVFGSCAGLILLASRVAGDGGVETLGAVDMTVRRNAFGRQAESFESDIAIKGLSDPEFRAVFIRAPWVEDTGPAVEVLATEPRTGKVVAVRQGPALATAFHPELTPDLRVHQIFTGMVREGGESR